MLIPATYDLSVFTGDVSTIITAVGISVLGTILVALFGTDRVLRMFKRLFSF